MLHPMAKLFFHLWVAGFLLLGLGCGKKEGKKEKKGEVVENKAPAADNDLGEADKGPLGGAERQGNKPVVRKIQYSGQIKLIVEDFGPSTRKLERLVEDFKGYVAQSEITNSPGQPRHGHWKIRVPVKEFDACREAVVKLGEAQKNSKDSKDVTEEYYDLRARLKNKKEEEDGLVQLYKRSSAKLEDILKVRSELTRVRTEIDQIQGQLQVLVQLTDLSTLDIDLYDRHDYVPPDAATYGTTLERTFYGSLQALLTFGKTLVIITVAAGPWIGAIAVVAAPAWFLYRRFKPRRRAPMEPIFSDEPPANPGTPERRD